PGSSTLITSQPKSPRSDPAYGPATWPLTSIAVVPSSAPLIILFLVQRFDEAARVNLLKQAVVDERLRIGAFCFGIFLFDESEHSLDALERRIRHRLVVFRREEIVGAVEVSFLLRA